LDDLPSNWDIDWRGRFTGNLAETRARFHNSKWSLYGTEQRGVLLGDPANYPLRDGR
jgi:hypothetical protein